MTKRIQKDLYKIIGITTDMEVICVDYYFNHGKEFLGYTGSRYQPVSKQEVRHYSTIKYAKEYLVDAIGTDEVKRISGSLDRGARIALAEMDGMYIGHDVPSSKYYNALEELGKNQQNIFGYRPETFTCVGGGRMFGGDSSITHKTKWALLLEPTLLEKILKLEK